MPPDVWAEINQLHARFVWCIDSGLPELAAGQFIESGQLIVPSDVSSNAELLVYEGRDAIRARWEGRSAISRHVFSNLWLEPIGTDSIRGKVLLTGYRNDSPTGAETTPLVISDFEDRIVRDHDGQWRFAERRGTIVFARHDP